MFSYSAYLLVWHLNVAQLESESVVESYIASMLKTTRILNLRWRYIDNGWKQSFAAVYCVIPVSRIHTSSKTIVSINTFAIRIPYDSIETFSIVSHLYYAFLTIDKLFFFYLYNCFYFFHIRKYLYLYSTHYVNKGIGYDFVSRLQNTIKKSDTLENLTKLNLKT